MANINLNIAPYYDDFDPNKDYVRVLFRPGFPIQGRELTTLQTFLQEQVSRFGNHFFKDGDRIKNAEVTLSTDVERLVLTGSGNLSFPTSGSRTNSILSSISTLEGKIISSADGTVKAQVIKQPVGSEATSQVGNLYIKYITGKKFPETGGYIYASTNDNPTEIAEFYNTFSSTSKSTLANISEGIFYIRGVFSRVQEQSVIVSTTSSTPSANIGFTVQTRIITQNEDATLFDNARGTTNEGAPGAHRLKQSIALSIRDIDAPADPEFYRVLTVQNGVIQEVVTGNPEYGDLGKTLARRTYDESGNYALKPFPISYAAAEDSDNKLELTIGASKAYVEGYEIEKIGSSNFRLDRGLTTKRTGGPGQAFRLPVGTVSSIAITSDTGVLPGFDGGNPYITSNRLLLRATAGGHPIGVARAYGIFDGRLHLYDIRMFQVVTMDSVNLNALVTGNDVYSGKTRGYIYKDDGGIAGTNDIIVIGANREFRVGQDITSTVRDVTAEVTAVRQYNISEVVQVVGNSGTYVATVDGTDYEGGNSQLIVTSDRHIATARGSASVFDNDFEIFEDSGSTTSTENGNWSELRVDDQDQIDKTIRFKYLKIRNTGTSARTGINYGWSAQDKEISLHFADVHQVYKINKSSNNTFANGRFERIDISTTGIIPQGSIIEGETSGTKAVVALSNSTVVGAGSHSSASDVHDYEEGTGSNTVLEVIYTLGSGFAANENITVQVPGGSLAFNSPVEYLKVTENVTKGSDVTGLFLLDNGQRNEYYDIGRLYRKDTSVAPSNGDLIVFYSYFEADPRTNHYYSADSYRDLGLFDEDVRFYTEPQEILPKMTDNGRDLRNSIDFRLRANEADEDAGVSPFNFAGRDFYNQSKVKPDTQFTFEFDEYLGRIDTISLIRDGSFKIYKGVPALDPKKPSETIQGMPLAYVTVPPAVRYPDVEINIEHVDNRRYTMRDIGQLEKRINNLEGAVALSLLESQALNDDIDGRSRMGFIVDDFSNQDVTIGDVNHLEWRASFDENSKQLIPGQTDGELIEMQYVSGSSSNVSSFFPNWIIKDFKEETMIEQKEATSGHKINPFATWVYNGFVELTPTRDYWRVPVHHYFTSLYGVKKPFRGNADDFDKFTRVTTASPGGRSRTIRTWTGETRTNTYRIRKRRFRRDTFREDTLQTQRVTEKLDFDTPRAIAGVAPTTTRSKKALTELPQDYWMRSIPISYAVSNLRPNTQHDVYFGETKVISNASTNADGELSGSFKIPPLTYKIGSQPVSFRDVETSGELSSAAQPFMSSGHFEHFDVTQRVTDSITTGRRTEEVVTSTRTFKGDPIAQTFQIPSSQSTSKQVLVGETMTGESETSIITSIDLWFKTIDTRSVNQFVVAEIREVLNGYPMGPEGVVGRTAYTRIFPSQETPLGPDNSNAVNFRFTNPVKLETDKEYAIVVLSPSNVTEVLVATIGEELIDGSGAIHDSQPFVGGHFGSFFVSQNQTTWTADQNTDLTFRLNRANFDVNDDGVIPSTRVRFESKASNEDQFDADIATAAEGLAFETYNNSNYVKVFHPNHGLNFANARVTISNVDTNPGGIPNSEFNTTHDVEYATLDTYFIKTSTKADEDGKQAVEAIMNGGVRATQCIAYDSIMTNYNILQDKDDSVSLRIRTTNTNSIDHRVDTNKIINDAEATPSVGDFEDVEIDDIVDFEEPKIVRNLLNAPANIDLATEVILESGDKYSSPYFRHNESNINPIVFRNTTGNFLDEDDLVNLTRREITSTSTDAQLQEFASYQAGIESETEHSAYVTRQVDLDLPADGFTVMFDADMEPSSSLEFSYKVRPTGDNTPFDQLEWIDFPSDQFVTEDNNGPFSSDPDETSYSIRAAVGFEFTSFKFRIRMRTENEAQTPKVSDLRIIADL